MTHNPNGRGRVAWRVSSYQQHVVEKFQLSLATKLTSGHGLDLEGNELDVPSGGRTPFPAHLEFSTSNKFYHFKHFPQLVIPAQEYYSAASIPVRDAEK